MAKAAIENEVVENEVDETEDGELTFEDRIKIVLANTEKQEEPSPDHPATLKFKEGVTLDSLMQETKYKKPTSFSVGLGEMRNFLRYETMVVETIPQREGQKAEKLKGQQLRQRLGLARGNFIKYCKDQTKPGNAKPTFKVVREGLELPQFSTRTVDTPDAIALLGDLLGDIEI